MKEVGISLEVCKSSKCKHFMFKLGKYSFLGDNGQCALYKKCIGCVNHQGCPIPKSCEFKNIHLLKDEPLKFCSKNTGRGECIYK